MGQASGMGVMRVCALLCGLCLAGLYAGPVWATDTGPEKGGQGRAGAGVQAEGPSLETMVGQLILVGFRGTGENPAAADLPDLLRSIRAGQVGGVVYFDRDVAAQSNRRNILSLDQLRALSALLQAESPIPLFIAVDQEGGRVARISPTLSGFALPSARRMGKGSPEHTFKAGSQTGAMLRDVGINLNFAPVADCDSNRNSPAIGAAERAFAASPDVVTAHARSFAEGQAQSGVVSCYKHFPGHGSATTDSHRGLTDITATWSRAELTPYLPENRPNVPLMIMPGHLSHEKLDPHLPASLSPAVVTDLLRGKLGWQGVVVSDDLQMGALTRYYSRKEIILLALNAGVDLLAIGNNLTHTPNLASLMHGEIMALVQEGRVSPERIRASYDRIMALKAQAGLL